MSPFEFVATPATSPRNRLSGSFSRSAESKRISGTEDWAAAGIPVRNVAAHIRARQATKKRFILILLFHARLFQHQFLHPPRLDLRDDDLIRIPAIHHVDHLETAQFLARMAELP